MRGREQAELGVVHNLLILTRNPTCQEENDGSEKDVEKSYSNKEVVDKLRRLANAENEKTFEIQSAGERIDVLPHATVAFEYERQGNEEEVEIELRWKRR